MLWPGGCLGEGTLFGGGKPLETQHTFAHIGIDEIDIYIYAIHIVLIFFGCEVQFVTLLLFVGLELCS